MNYLSLQSEEERVLILVRAAMFAELHRDAVETSQVAATDVDAIWSWVDEALAWLQRVLETSEFKPDCIACNQLSLSQHGQDENLICPECRTHLVLLGLGLIMVDDRWSAMAQRMFPTFFATGTGAFPCS